MVLAWIENDKKNLMLLKDKFFDIFEWKMELTLLLTKWKIELFFADFMLAVLRAMLDWMYKLQEVIKWCHVWLNWFFLCWFGVFERMRKYCSHVFEISTCWKWGMRFSIIIFAVYIVWSKFLLKFFRPILLTFLKFNLKVLGGKIQ